MSDSTHKPKYKAATLIYNNGVWNLFDCMHKRFIFEPGLDEKAMKEVLMRDQGAGNVDIAAIDERMDRARQFGNAMNPPGKWKTEQVTLNNTNGVNGRCLPIGECFQRFLSKSPTVVNEKRKPGREAERQPSLELEL